MIMTPRQASVTNASTRSRVTVFSKKRSQQSVYQSIQGYVLGFFVIMMKNANAIMPATPKPRKNARVAENRRLIRRPMRSAFAIGNAPWICKLAVQSLSEK